MLKLPSIASYQTDLNCVQLPPILKNLDTEFQKVIPNVISLSQNPEPCSENHSCEILSNLKHGGSESSTNKEDSVQEITDPSEPKKRKYTKKSDRKVYTPYPPPNTNEVVKKDHVSDILEAKIKDLRSSLYNEKSLGCNDVRSKVLDIEAYMAVVKAAFVSQEFENNALKGQIQMLEQKNQNLENVLIRNLQTLDNFIHPQDASSFKEQLAKLTSEQEEAS